MKVCISGNEYYAVRGLDGEVILVSESGSDASSRIKPGSYAYDNGGPVFQAACDKAAEIEESGIELQDCP